MERHDPDVTSLVAGLLFVALGVAFLLDRLGTVSLNLGLVWPVVLIALGLAGLLRSVPSRRRESDDGPAAG